MMHWCPNGCGKKVIFYRRHSIFFCTKCLENFTRKYLSENNCYTGGKRRYNQGKLEAKYHKYLYCPHCEKIVEKSQCYVSYKKVQSGGHNKK